MANRDIEDFEVFYGGQYPLQSQSDHHHGDQHSHLLAYPSTSMSVGNYAYPPHNPMLAFDPTADNVSMSMGPENAFPYDISTYPSTASLGHGLVPLTSFDRPGLDHGHAYSPAQPPESAAGMYWGQPSNTGGIGLSMQTPFPRQSVSTHPTDTSIGKTLLKCEQQQDDQGLIPQTSSHGPIHRYIQPKKSSSSKDSAGTISVATGERSPYANIYSSSGFDVMGILAQVASRLDPQINIGPVDLSCAFVLCETSQEDHPIVYVSQAFERLTGYNEREIIGRNCRFLQSPDGVVAKGEPRKFTDSYTTFRLLKTIQQGTELQVSMINYRKGGQPFLNLVTMIPVHRDNKDYFVGFQVDLVEKPDAVKKRNPDGTYMIDYHRSQLPNYVAPSPDQYYDDHDPATQFGPGQVSVIMDNLAGGQPVAKNHMHHVLVENTDDVIMVLSPERNFLYLSPSCRTVLEYKSTDLLGKTLSTICHPSDIGPVIRDLRACTSSEPFNLIYRIRRKNSGYAWFHNHGGWHISERGRQFMVLVGRVIPVYSLRQLARIECGGLAENDLWAKLSLSGIILYISSKARAVLGRSHTDLIGKGIQDIIVSDHSQQDRGIQQALETSRSGQQTTLTHKIRHRKGHIFPAQTTLYPGDTVEGESKPTFLVAQLRFPKAITSSADEQSVSATSSDTGLGEFSTNAVRPSMQHPRPHPNYPEPFTTSGGTITAASPGEPETPSALFEELNPTRGSSWQFELRELEKQNRTLAEEAQRLLAKRKKRKRKQNAVAVEKTCAMCQTKSTPEWRRGPSGNRDLCNGCGLRWAKQVKNLSQGQVGVS
ncbi:PAS domain-containing protein [Aspergillus californicus]